LNIWKGRFHAEPRLQILRFTQSLDLDWRLFEYDIEGSVAHVRMLCSVGLLTEEERDKLVEALREIKAEIARGELPPSIALEDLHLNVEHRLIEKLGPLGAKVHTGRSRNDQICVDVRMYLRDQLKELRVKTRRLLNTLLELAERDVDVIIPGYTHLQQGQPISAGHYWMAYFWKFLRDLKRLDLAIYNTDENPLGSGALAGSTLPLDREFTRRELGFSRNTENSLDAVSNRDFMLDFHYFASTFMVHCSRLAEDLVIYASGEFGYVELPDEYCTGSSMMPQKKNPDVLELIRGKAGQVFGHLLDLMVTLKGLPLAYNRDMQEDKRGLWAALATVHSVLDILPGMLSATRFNQERILQSMRDGFILATDVAEYLVMKGVPFREAHGVVGRAVRDCFDSSRTLFDLTLEDWRRYHPAFDEDVFEVLDLQRAVDRRRTYGGTARSEVRRQLERGREILRELD